MLTRNRKKDTTAKEAMSENTRPMDSNTPDLPPTMGAIAEQENARGMTLRSRNKGRVSPSADLGRVDQEPRGTKRNIEDTQTHMKVCILLSLSSLHVLTLSYNFRGLPQKDLPLTRATVQVPVLTHTMPFPKI